MILHYYAVIITETNNRIEVDGMIDYNTYNYYKHCDYFSIDDYELIKKEILKKELDKSDIVSNQVSIRSLSVIKE